MAQGERRGGAGRDVRGMQPAGARRRGTSLCARLPLHLRLLIGMTLPLAVVVLAALGILIGTEAASLRAEMKHRLESIVMAMANDFHRVSLMDDQDVGVEIAERLRAFEEIDRLWLFDPGREAVFSYAKPGRAPAPAPASWEGERGVVRVPIRASGQELGYVLVEPSWQALRERTWRMVGGLAAVAGVMLVGGLGMARLVGRSIAAPIERVSRCVAEAAETLDTSRRVEVRDRHEIGALAAAINRFLEVITIQRTQLEQTNARIEREVEQRTRELRASERRIRVLATYAPVGIFETDPQGRCNFVNRAWTELTGVGHEAAVGTKWLEVIADEDRRTIEPVWQERVETEGDYGVECRLAGEGSAPVWVSCGVVGLRDDMGRLTGFLGTFTDVTERRRLEEELRFGALHDRLTGLPNRQQLRDRLDRALARAAEGAGGAVALFYLDFDRFKSINDTLGHEGGDAFLMQAAGRIAAFSEEMARRHGLVVTPARLGGDEFVVLIEGAFDRAEVEGEATALSEVLAGRYEVDGREVRSSASIGVVFRSAEHGGIDDLLRDADTAMYHRKVEGRRGVAVFDPSMRTASRARERTAAELKSAVASGQFVLRYQPIVSLGTRRPVGFEALVRWSHPTRGLLSPGEFLDVAESSGLIVPMGRWALREACRQLRTWQSWMPDPEPLFVSVNLSRRHLEDASLEGDVKAALQESGIRPDSLVIEITESEIMRDASAAIDLLHRLRGIGVRVAMDDFGTGYSSLAWLRRLPLDLLKIDRSFVTGLTGDKRTLAILQAIITLAENLGVDVVSEGVEHAEEVAPLIALECRLGQGYYFSRPLPAEQIPAWCVRAAAPMAVGAERL